MSSQKKYKTSNGSERLSPDDPFYQGMLKAMDERKGMTDFPWGLGDLGDMMGRVQTKGS